MSRLNRLISHTLSTRTPFFMSQQHLFPHEQRMLLLPPQHLYQLTSPRFLDSYQFGNKEAIQKERARLADEMNRGYFADISELKQHGGKIAMANKIIVPAMAAVKFPDLEVRYSSGRNLKLPIRSVGNVVDANKSAIPKASLLCLTFRANSQAMVDSWSMPFLEAYRDSKKVQLYEVSFLVPMLETY
ncbi:Mitochondria isoform 1 [Tripterygium wilfordii]|uniref:Mitochondria isoform 1 n=1 Tax=Tripterygium wilfordii TaxID=458696 RepID=A0A7J7DEL6_TRIWF|nr:Mitochondria isoform 1 [Tripterygium wilfordii]